MNSTNQKIESALLFGCVIQIMCEGVFVHNTKSKMNFCFIFNVKINRTIYHANVNGCRFTWCRWCKSTRNNMNPNYLFESVCDMWHFRSNSTFFSTHVIQHFFFSHLKFISFILDFYVIYITFSRPEKKWTTTKFCYNMEDWQLVCGIFVCFVSLHFFFYFDRKRCNIFHQPTSVTGFFIRKMKIIRSFVVKKVEQKNGFR